MQVPTCRIVFIVYKLRTYINFFNVRRLYYTTSSQLCDLVPNQTNPFHYRYLLLVLCLQHCYTGFFVCRSVEILLLVPASCFFVYFLADEEGNTIPNIRLLNTVRNDKMCLIDSKQIIDFGVDNHELVTVLLLSSCSVQSL